MVHNGIESRTLAMPEARERVTKLCPELVPQRYLIWVGIPSVRKNLDLLFQIFAEHHRRFPDHHFVIVTFKEFHADMQRRADAQGLGDRLKLFAGLDNPTRDALYHEAIALIFPSNFEGFGYPNLEAMYQGCPSFSLRGTVMQELLEGVMPLVAEPTVAAFTAALQPYIGRPENERAVLSRQLIARAGQFSAEAMAAKTLAVIREAVA